MNDGLDKEENCCERNQTVFKSKICPRIKVQEFNKTFNLYPDFKEFNCLSVNSRVSSGKKDPRGCDVSMLRKSPDLEGSSTSGSDNTIKNTVGFHFKNRFYI